MGLMKGFFISGIKPSVHITRSHLIMNISTFTHK